MLSRTQAELRFVLEENWAIVGWELQQAEQTSDIREALQCIQRINCRHLEAFFREYGRETTFQQLQATRKRLRDLFGKLREAQPRWEKCRESAEVAQAALRNANDAQMREELSRICRESKSATARAYKALRRLQNLQAEFDETLLQQEASIAQSQLLDFIQSDRYASTPQSFANAMAGLPTIHWRQSVERCHRFRDNAPQGVTYERFLIVAEALKHTAANADEAVEGMKNRLLQAKGREANLLNALAENWYFLRCAIEAAFRGERPPVEALPYRILAEYAKRFGSRSPQDRLLAEREAITTAAYLKERAKQAQPWG